MGSDISGFLSTVSLPEITLVSLGDHGHCVWGPRALCLEITIAVYGDRIRCGKTELTVMSRLH